MIPCIEIAELFLAGPSYRVYYSAAIGGPTWVLMTRVEFVATRVRARRGPPQESPVTTARSHEGLEIDCGGRRPGLANTPAYAVDNLRFYDRQKAYVSARPLRPQNPNLTLLQNEKRDVDARDRIRPSARQSSTRKSHSTPDPAPGG